jgi:hypothetical protein
MAVKQQKWYRPFAQRYALSKGQIDEIYRVILNYMQ